MLIGGPNVPTTPEVAGDLDAAISGLLDRFIAHAETDPRLHGRQDQAIANALSWIVGFTMKDAIQRISALQGGLNASVIVGLGEVVAQKTGMAAKDLPPRIRNPATSAFMTAIHVGAMKAVCTCTACRNARGEGPVRSDA